MQQLSGSVGRGGTMTPAMFLDAASISALRSPGPARREPKTIHAFARVSSFAVFGNDSGGGGVGAVPVIEGTSLIGRESSSGHHQFISLCIYIHGQIPA
jgi:hypothetical protein